MFARKMLLSYQQILDMFDNNLTEEDKKFLETYYSHGSNFHGVTKLSYNQYFEHIQMFVVNLQLKNVKYLNLNL